MQQRRRSLPKVETSTNSKKAEVLPTSLNKNHKQNEVILHTKTKIDKSQLCVTPLFERNSLGFDCSGVHVSPIIVNLVTHKENISPLTPNNVMNLIDKMNFTPATETRTAAYDKSDNLDISLTPLNHKNTKKKSSETSRLLLPRHVIEDVTVKATTSKHLPEIYIEEVFNNTRDAAEVIVSNKTFEVKSSEILFASSPNESLQEGLLSSSSSGNVMNKTEILCVTATVRPLEMIQEEEGNCSSISNNNHLIQKTFTKKPADIITEETNVFKLDINRVLTPLRKYSESMRDLSISSSTSKLAIQGSMPNLNEMENIRSIEQNRYYFQAGNPKVSSTKSLQKNAIENSLDDSNDNSSSSQTSLISHADNMFNQNEILAQSSRFNINEIGCKTRYQSPDKNNIKKNPKMNFASSTCSKNSTSQSQRRTELTGSKRSSRELYCSDSPSNESIASSCGTTKTYKKSGKLLQQKN